MSSVWSLVAAPVLFQQIVEWGQNLPHCKALGLELVAAERGRITLALPFRPQLVGNPETGVLHGGVITTLADTACAFSIYTLLENAESVATLDLRIDYLRPGEAELPLYCVAECYRLTSQIAFTRATVFQEDASEPVAHIVATYMRSSLPGGGRP